MPAVRCPAGGDAAVVMRSGIIKVHVACGRNTTNSKMCSHVVKGIACSLPSCMKSVLTTRVGRNRIFHSFF